MHQFTTSLPDHGLRMRRHDESGHFDGNRAREREGPVRAEDQGVRLVSWYER